MIYHFVNEKKKYVLSFSGLLNIILYNKGRETFRNDEYVSHLTLLVPQDLCQTRVPTFHTRLFLS